MSIQTRAGEDRRAALVEFVRDFWALNGHGPSMREVARGLGFRSPSGAYYEVKILIAAGVLTRKPLAARTLRVVER